MHSYVTVAVVAAVVAAAMRVAFIAIYRSWFRQGFAGDAAFHLAVIRELKHHRRYSGVPHFLIKDEPDTYPILFHRLAAALPLRVIERHPYALNLILWVLLSTAAAVYAQYVSASLLHRQDLGVALVFIAVFGTLASNLSSDGNGLNYISLSERLLSRFACGFYFAALAIGMSFGDLPSLALAVVAGTAAALSSMFARQAVAFATPLTALIALDPRPMEVMALSALLALLADGRYFLRGIRHMVLFLRAYNRHIKHSRYYKLGLSRFTNWRLVLFRHVGLSRLVELETQEPTRILFRYPELILLGIIWISRGVSVADPAFAVVVATLGVYLATSTAALHHLGEANRYIEFNLWILAALLIAIEAGEGGIPGSVWLAYAAWLALVTWRKWKSWRALRLPDFDQLLALVAPLRLGAAHTVLTVPVTLGAAICVRAPCRALTYQGSAITLPLLEKFMEEIPLLKRDWRQLARECAVTHIIAEKGYLGTMKNVVGWEYDFSGLRTLAESEIYVVYAAPGDAVADTVAAVEAAA
jgi:hypothetical protein